MTSTSVDSVTEQHRLRRHLRAARGRLSTAEVVDASRRVQRRILRMPLLWSGRRFALYRAHGNEIDLSGLEMRLLAAGRQCALPVLSPRGLGHGLFFQRHCGDEPMCRNRFGIDEPCFDPRRCIPSRFLSVIFVPLLGFDSRCNRIGMGGGFYDRALAFRRTSLAVRPLLVGVAHDCQSSVAIEPNPWDVPIDAVVTESRVVVRERGLWPWFANAAGSL